MPRPLAKMSDSEFLAYLRRSRGKGKPLVEVFADEMLALEQRCALLTYTNALRMLNAPGEASMWWAPNRIIPCCHPNRAKEVNKLFPRLPDGGAIDIVRSKGLPFDILEPLVWFEAEYLGTATTPQVRTPIFGLPLKHTKHTTLAEWRGTPVSDLVWAPSHQYVAWYAQLTCDIGKSEATYGGLRSQDGEARTTFTCAARSSLGGSPERVFTPWCGVEPQDRSLKSLMEIKADADRFSTFAYEVPYLVDANLIG